MICKIFVNQDMVFITKCQTTSETLPSYSTHVLSTTLNIIKRCVFKENTEFVGISENAQEYK